jgi:hypothetical protein
MPERVRRPEEDISPRDAGWRLAQLSAFAHCSPGRVADRLYALMGVHKAVNAPACKAYHDALALLDELGARAAADAWVRTHAGHAGIWPTAELAEMRERVRATAP